MSYQVNVQDAKTRLSELLARVERGEEITIARAGRPIARLVAVEQPAKRALGFAPGKLDDTFFEPLADDELSVWVDPA
jgi:prevent-host-death family protein